jgi:hypothetical protein
MKKCAWIRSDQDQGQGKCPFGLPITEACRHAGDAVTHMCPLKSVPEEKREPVEKANKRVYLYYKTDSRCLYAANIIEKHKAVNCDFGDTAAGMHTPTLSGSPLYAQTFSGIGLDGLYAFPLGFYADNNESRNLFQGLFSLVGNEAYDLIKESALNISPAREILEKISNNEPLSTDEQLELAHILSKCRQRYDENATDTGKLYELIRLWNPRKRL